jgi:hypothetical protein
VHQQINSPFAHKTCSRNNAQKQSEATLKICNFQGTKNAVTAGMTKTASAEHLPNKMNELHDEAMEAE